MFLGFKARPVPLATPELDNMRFGLVLAFPSCDACCCALILVLTLTLTHPGAIAEHERHVEPF